MKISATLLSMEILVDSKLSKIQHHLIMSPVHFTFCQELQYNTCAPSSCSGYNVHLLYELMPCSCKNVGQYSKCISQHIWIITFVAIFRIIIHTVIWYLGCTHVLIFQGNMKHLLILLSYKKLYFIPFIFALQFNTYNMIVSSMMRKNWLWQK